MKYLAAFLDSPPSGGTVYRAEPTKPTKPSADRVLKVLKPAYPKNPRDSRGSIVRERITDRAGRTLAVRWVSAIIGDMWVTFDRATALRCGLVRPGGPPVFYLATDDVEFFKVATPEQLERLAEFKRVFLSPEIPQ